jgi:hypothetical protein
MVSLEKPVDFRIGRNAIGHERIIRTGAGNVERPKPPHRLARKRG